MSKETALLSTTKEWKEFSVLLKMDNLAVGSVRLDLRISVYSKESSTRQGSFFYFSGGREND
jgi:hypothetical protein